ncbi:MAG: hypothetical protein U5P10_02495 [Spirochaetia bacterium]|nr:hypothetical protein [Spirochaetia bacterium]
MYILTTTTPCGTGTSPPRFESSILEYIEFIYYLRKIGYSDYLTSDTSPTRWPIRDTFEINSRLTNKIWKLLDSIDEKQLDKLIHGDDYMQTWRFIEENLLGLK